MTLTGYFWPSTLPVTVAELRPQHGEHLTDDALAPILGRATRTARRTMARWRDAWAAWEAAVQANPHAPAPNLPRVVRLETGKPGRPAHAVERASLDAWRRRFKPRPLAAQA
jgi:hypothetical protein